MVKNFTPNSIVQTLIIFGLLLMFSSAQMALAKSNKKSHKKYSSSSRHFTPKGAKAIDGDTFVYKGKKYRVTGYNAPEKGKPGAKAATKRLQKKLDKGRVKARPRGKDKYGRTLVDIE